MAPIFCNGFPKSGNHALAKAVQLLGLPAKVNHVAYADRPKSDVRAGNCVFIRRDPRDCIVSWLRWTKQTVSPGTFLAAFRSFDGRPLVDAMSAYEGWLWELAAHVVRYEDLVRSDSAMRRLAGYLGVVYIEGAWELLPGITVTWNEARSDYRQVWTPDVRKIWAAEGGDNLLERWGY